MKKVIITSAFALFSVVAFSQTAEVKNGKAVETIPAKEVELTKGQMLSKKEGLEEQVVMLQQELITIQKRLDAAKLQLANYKEVCDQLGYKE